MILLDTYNKYYWKIGVTLFFISVASCFPALGYIDDPGGFDRNILLKVSGNAFVYYFFFGGIFGMYLSYKEKNKGYFFRFFVTTIVLGFPILQGIAMFVAKLIEGIQNAH